MYCEDEAAAVITATKDTYPTIHPEFCTLLIANVAKLQLDIKCMSKML